MQTFEIKIHNLINTSKLIVRGNTWTSLVRFVENDTCELNMRCTSFQMGFRVFWL